jgi:signal transduction histidine kinase
VSKPSDGVYKSTHLHYKKSKEIIEVEIYATLIIVNNKNLMAVIAIDVTEKNLYEHKIIKAIIKTQEDERYEIGSELHDNVCQLLATSKLNLGMLKASLTPSNTQWFDQCEEYLVLAMKEIRNLSHRIAPAFFDNTTFEEAIKKLLDVFNIEEKFTIQLHFADTGNKHAMSREIELNLYRILQEQLKNILNYAKATLIEVDLLIYNDKLKMKVSDNGIGFNVDTIKGGIGIANMKRRTELLSGKFEIDSSPGNGSKIIIDIPLLEN